MTLIYIILATLIISVGSFLGVFTLALNRHFLQKILKLIIAFAAGTMLGTTFFHLLPEAAVEFSDNSYLTIVLASFIGFLLIENLLFWHHCHDEQCHTLGYMNLIGDAIHNFTDGLIIAGTFVIDVNLGIITTIAIAAHEIPQEIGDFGTLLYSGFSKRSALLANIGVALTSVLGGVVGYYLTSSLESISIYLIPVAAGGFLYIATSDLIPEFRNQTKFKQVLLAFSLFISGILLMYFLNTLTPDHAHESKESSNHADEMEEDHQEEKQELYADEDDH